MKKFLILLIVAFSACIIAACGTSQDKEQYSGNTSAGGSAISETSASTAASASAPTSASSTEPTLPEEEKNLLVFDFKGLGGSTSPIAKKGVRFAATEDTHYDEIYKNDKLVLANGNGIRIVSRISEAEDVWARKITFVFSSGKENLTYVTFPGDKSTYENGLLTSGYTTPNLGDAEIVFKATGEVVIDYVIVETEDYAANLTTIAVVGADTEDKIYYTVGSYEPEAYKDRLPYSADVKFEVFGTYFFFVEPAERHAKYYELTYIRNESDVDLEPYSVVPDEMHPEVSVKAYRYNVSEVEGQNSLTLTWRGKSAASSIKVDEASALTYLRGFMETEPVTSCGFPAEVIFGQSVKLSPVAKKGYGDIKLIYNGEVVTETSDDEVDYYEIVIADRDENTIAFSAEKREMPEGVITIGLTGENAGKAEIVGVVKDGSFMFAVRPTDDHPTAEATKVVFNGSEIAYGTFAEGEGYKLSEDQTAAFTAAATVAEKAALFTVTIEEDTSYECAVNFNRGDFQISVKDKTPVSGEEDPTIVYSVAAGGDVVVTVTPLENKDIFAIEVNDERLKESDYTKNADGSITYTFKATAKENLFIIQTVNQKVTLTCEVTAGYTIQDFPKEAVDCGVLLSLRLAPADDMHYLFGKKVTVNYDGKDTIVQSTEEGDFFITVLPVKTVTVVKVTVEDMPLED